MQREVTDRRFGSWSFALAVALGGGLTAATTGCSAIGPCKGLEEGDQLVFQVESRENITNECDFDALGLVPGSTIRMSVESFQKGSGVTCFGATGTVAAVPGWSYGPGATSVSWGYFEGKPMVSRDDCSGWLEFILTDPLDASGTSAREPYGERAEPASVVVEFGPSAQAEGCPPRCRGQLIGQVRLERLGA